MPRPIPFSEADARAAIAAAKCWADALRFLGYSVKGSNYKTLRRHVERWNIPTDHFDPNVGRRRASLTRQVPLGEVLVENSTYPRGLVKYRLLALGIKLPLCELCGQGEEWNGRRMSLVLDHVNGVANDHRLENLRMVCPNCAATFDTHCGRNLPRRGSVQPVATPSRLSPSITAIARDRCFGPHQSRRTMRGEAKARSVARPSVRRTSSCLLRSKPRASSPWVASTACRTTPYGSGCAGTSTSANVKQGRARHPRMRA